jgi:hypothetical protein
MKSSSLRLMIAIVVLLAVSVACSLPFTLRPDEPEEKIVYVVVTSEPVPPAATLPPAATPLPAAEPTLPAVTPTVSVNLDGLWTIWQGTGEQQLSINFLQKGYSLIGNTATGDGESLLYKGTISQDGKSVTGTWDSTTGTSGSFLMYLDGSLTMFSGNMGGGVPFCGNRSGTTKPSPCIK